MDESFSLNPQPSALNPHPYIEVDICSDMRGWGVDYGS